MGVGSGLMRGGRSEADYGPGEGSRLKVGNGPGTMPVQGGIGGAKVRLLGGPTNIGPPPGFPQLKPRNRPKIRPTVEDMFSIESGEADLNTELGLDCEERRRRR
ncbi:hypothetical protein Salat_0839300 [Sesamum alatum]|uniref:Uncharacterized protein n=1 Tax=Sesamum alatum TaxID=300844 RepID=A0AAE2CQG6_9LAMI|nr:hypothetical protein Salat_0839300 [Sesamum alatum]